MVQGEGTDSMHYTNAFIRGKKAPFRGVFKYKDASGEWRQTVRTLKAQGIAEAKRELAELRLELEDEHERRWRLPRPP